MKPKIPFDAFDSYCLRTPGLPRKFLEELLGSANVEKSLKKILKDPFVREALYLGSSDFFTQLLLWENDATVTRKKNIRITVTLLKYLTRMSTRCTPFGLFAGCSIGIWGNETSIHLKDKKHYEKVTRYDMHFLAALSKHISTREHIKNQLRYYPNSTLYRLGGRYRYVEYAYEGKKRIHSIESVVHSPYLETIITSASNGMLLQEGIDYLMQEGFDASESSHFIDELVRHQILISELEPTITGKDFLEVLKSKLVPLKRCEEELQLLELLHHYQKRLSGTSQNSASFFKTVRQQVSSLKIDVDPKFLLQTDLYPKFISNQLDRKILQKIELGLWVLNKLSTPQKNRYLEAFKTEFNKRYEHQKVPLLQLLDTESGIGYGNSKVEATPFLDDIKLPVKVEKELEVLSPFQKILLDKLRPCLTNRDECIKLEIRDLDNLENNWNSAPDTLSVLGEITVQNGKEIVFMEWAGAHALRLLGRFAMNRNAVHKSTLEIAKKEDELNSGSILAEIVHIPESRTGNILRRPNLRTHEIPCLGFSMLERDQQILLRDIYVSVQGDTIILTHKPTGKKVLPRLSNAHNYISNPLPVYQFLCDLQYQNQHDYSFEWGSLFENFDYLPRVVFKDIILSKARWKIRNKALDQLKTICSDEKDPRIQEKITLWKQELKMPKSAQLVEGDNLLLIDFNSIWSIQLLYQNIKHRKSFVLQEILEDEKPLVKQKDNSFKNEFVFSFYRTTLKQSWN